MNEASGFEEKVGFVMLDLRAASRPGGGESSAQWMPLQNTLYSKEHPELKLSLEVETSGTDDPVAEEPTSQQSSPQRPSPRRPPTRQHGGGDDAASSTGAPAAAAAKNGGDAPREKPGEGEPRRPLPAQRSGGALSAPRPPPVFTGADGTVNVGDGKDLFTLNVDLGAAIGLVGLASEAADAGDDFPAHHYFMFTLLGAERSMEALPVLRDRMNVSQGAVVRLRGTWSDVCTALAAARTLRVFFLSSDECLVATATIPLDYFFNAKPQPPEEPLHDKFPLTPYDAGARPAPTLEVTVGLHPASQKLNDMISRLLDQREGVPKDRYVGFFFLVWIMRERLLLKMSSNVPATFTARFTANHHLNHCHHHSRHCCDCHCVGAHCKPTMSWTFKRLHHFSRIVLL